MPDRFCFDRFELDSRGVELLRDGRPVKLPPQPLRLLALLARRAGSVVSREELCRELWGHGTHVQFEGSLHSCVKQIRAALGDDASAPRFIETLPRRGYRFLPSVRSSTRRRTPGWWLAGGLGLAATLFVSFGRTVPEPGPRAGAGAPVVVAVLPFANATGEEDQAYLPIALAEQTIEHLAAIDPGKLLVLAPRTAERYRGVRHAPEVDYELRGRTVRVDGELRLDVELVHVPEERTVWSDRVDPLAGRLAAAVVPHLVDVPFSSGVQAPEAAIEADLRGRYHLRQRDPGSLDRAERSFREAVAIAPGFAAPHTGLAEVHLRRAWRPDGGRVGAFEAALASAERSLDIEPSAEAHFVLALAAWYGGLDWETAGRGFQRAIVSSPGLARAHHWYAYYLTALGRHAEAILEIERARRLDPLSPAVQSDVGWFYYFAGRYLEAIEASRRTLALEPGFPLAEDCIIEAHLALGDEDAALREASRFAGRTFSDLGELWSSRLEERRDPYERGLAALRLGREAEAIARLGDAVAIRSPWMPLLGVDPRLGPLRGRDELGAILQSAGLGRSDVPTSRPLPAPHP